MRLSVPKERRDQAPRLLDEVVVGVPELGQAAQVFRLIGGRHLQEVLETRAVGPLGRFLGHGDGGLQDLGDQRLDERVLRGEPSIERAHAHPGRRGPRPPRWPRVPFPRTPGRPPRAVVPGSSTRRCVSVGWRPWPARSVRPPGSYPEISLRLPYRPSGAISPLRAKAGAGVLQSWDSATFRTRCESARLCVEGAVVGSLAET